jgi:hypothetical protein
MMIDIGLALSIILLVPVYHNPRGAEGAGPFRSSNSRIGSAAADAAPDISARHRRGGEYNGVKTLPQESALGRLQIVSQMILTCSIAPKILTIYRFVKA